MMLDKFRSHYPQGSLLSEFIDIDRGVYLVKVTIEVEGVLLATGLASGETIELAEDRARQRAIAAVIIDRVSQVDASPITPPPQTPLSQPESARVESSPQIPLKSNGSPQFLPNIRDNKAFVSSVEPEIDETQGSLFPTSLSAPETVDLADEVEKFNLATTEIATIEPEESPENTNTSKIDFSEIKHQTDLQIKRLCWTREDGRNFLQTHYGKRSRLHLDDEQLLEFLRYLESLPDPS